jgi:hypothetical protein
MPRRWSVFSKGTVVLATSETVVDALKGLGGPLDQGKVADAGGWRAVGVRCESEALR